jgi:hypothetical protein
MTDAWVDGYTPLSAAEPASKLATPHAFDWPMPFETWVDDSHALLLHIQRTAAAVHVLLRLPPGDAADALRATFAIVRQFLLYGVCAYKKVQGVAVFGPLERAPDDRGADETPRRPDSVEVVVLLADVAEARLRAARPDGEMHRTAAVEAVVWLPPRDDDAGWATELYARYREYRGGLGQQLMQFVRETVRRGNAPIAAGGDLPPPTAPDRPVRTATLPDAILRGDADMTPENLVRGQLLDGLTGGVHARRRPIDEVMPHVVWAPGAPPLLTYPRHAPSFSRVRSAAAELVNPPVAPLEDALFESLGIMVQYVVDKLATSFPAAKKLAIEPKPAESAASASKSETKSETKPAETAAKAAPKPKKARKQ